MFGILFYSLLSCSGDIRIAKEKTQNDTYDSIQESPEYSDENEEQEEVEDADDPELAEDFVYRGPYQVLKEDRSAGVTNCDEMSFTVYSPAGVINPAHRTISRRLGHQGHDDPEDSAPPTKTHDQP